MARKIVAKFPKSLKLLKNSFYKTEIQLSKIKYLIKWFKYKN